MSYSNQRHQDRLIVFTRVRAMEDDRSELETACYNFPFLFHSSGTPWHEANAYLVNVADGMWDKARPADELRRRASKLLDYLLFCDDEGIDWLDFSGKRPAQRPTYKYYAYLTSRSARSNAVINQYTAVIYDFYQYVSQTWHSIDMRLVDEVKNVKFLVGLGEKVKVVSALKRSQTKPTPPRSSVPLGFVMDAGEYLRPLDNDELASLLEMSRDQRFSQLERLLIYTSLMTGARKQTVLTMRVKHLQAFDHKRLREDGCYLLHAGPRTGIDTKHSKPQKLYFPRQLAEALVRFAMSPTMKNRRKRLVEQIEARCPNTVFADEDCYIFLSNQGGCYYMAENDPRYLTVKSPPSGQVTDTIKRKLLKHQRTTFPNAFTYHWLRATYAFQLYQSLRAVIEAGIIQPGDDIDFIRERMHHSNRETTEQYLNLFRMLPARVVVQEFYESKLFGEFVFE